MASYKRSTVQRAPRSGPAMRLQEMRVALARLDVRLRAAIAAFDAAHDGPVIDRLRGLVITPDQCSTLLQLDALSSILSPPDGRSHGLWPCHAGTWAQHLQATFGLDDFDIDALLLALAPELDLRYERLFAYLQDDATRRRPTIALALDLLVADSEARLAMRARFATDAPLLRHDLLHCAADANLPHAPLLGHVMLPDQQLLHFMLGEQGLHPELAASAMREKAPAAGVTKPHLCGDTIAHLERLAALLRAGTKIPPVWLHSSEHDAAAQVGRALARKPATSLLRIDATRVPPRDAERVLRLARRDAWLRSSILCIEHADAWIDEPGGWGWLAEALTGVSCPLILASAHALPVALLGLALPLELPPPEAAEREACWVAALARHGDCLPGADSRAIAARFRLGRAQIAAAVDDAYLRSTGQPTHHALQAAARRQSGDALARVADKVDAKATWNDIVLPPNAASQLRELCDRMQGHERVFNDWGFGRKLSRGRGTAALFSGGSGTGKTMAAEVIANTLGLDLYRIDLARVVSKYIGETEKNLDRVFDAAERANAILFFDEADALFGKRSEVKEAHDRYANIEVSYLLQKMEDYEGFAILASNLPASVDAAFTRRLAYCIHFPLPDEAARLEIWRRAWPGAVPIADDIDCRALARELKIAGGGIRNIALGAAFSAAANGGVVDRAHVAHAVVREYEKSGRASALPAHFAASVPPFEAVG